MPAIQDFIALQAGTTHLYKNNDGLTPAFQVFPITLAPLEEKLFPCAGEFLYVSEADYSPFQIALDNNGFVDWDLALQYKAPKGFFFNQFRIKNTSAYASTYKVIAGFGSVDDFRLNIVETRNGSAASLTPPTLDDSITLTFGAGNANTWVLLTPANANRERVRLWTDEANQNAWFSSVPAGRPLTAGNRIGQNTQQYTELYYKGDIYVRAANGVTIGALSFQY